MGGTQMHGPYAPFFEEDGVERCRGTDIDVRALVAGLPSGVKDGLRYREVPWSRFCGPYGTADEVPDHLDALRSDGEAADRGLRGLDSDLWHQGGTYAPAALAAPFLVRIAAGSARRRAEILWMLGATARRPHFGDGSRAGLLQTTSPGGMYDTHGYPAHWTVEAVRGVLAADASLLLPLLDDPVPEVRRASCYVLAAAATAPGISAALRDRLAVEDVPEVRASLVPAIAQRARDHHDPRSAAAWARTLWADPGRPAEIRVSAAVAWLALVDDPVPGALLEALADTVTGDVARVMDAVPWIRDVDAGGAGLSRCLVQMLGTDARDVLGIDAAPWPGGDPFA
ncbi:HEAT repeat domain-containing protein [Actinomadura algeriensis]|uniref:HEAT repeat protein n=1 Tax=Actinomadura algeriensis TaxID=1679523 RepID=A0ABR9JJ03_9ACTN|nr:HEAT repeat domain-containing protein [Actinomadura algeriensis]MBE1530530.1 hypothetical protein [Actinomadura algeriensis]